MTISLRVRDMKKVNEDTSFNTSYLSYSNDGITDLNSQSFELRDLKMNLKQN